MKPTRKKTIIIDCERVILILFVIYLCSRSLLILAYFSFQLASAEQSTRERIAVSGINHRSDKSNEFQRKKWQNNICCYVAGARMLDSRINGLILIGSCFRNVIGSVFFYFQCSMFMHRLSFVSHTNLSLTIACVALKWRTASANRLRSISQIFMRVQMLE